MQSLFRYGAPVEVALFGGAGIVEALGISLPLWAWCVITSVGVTWMGGVWWADASGWISRNVSDFDMPIEAAVDHIVDTTHHTFTRSSLAEMNAFAQLHTAMCSGRLPVIGREGEATTPRKISRRQCKRLDCIEEATPQGIRFQLIDREQNKRIADGMKRLREGSITRFEESALIGFSELRVRSKDVYGIWPQNMEGGA